MPLDLSRIDAELRASSKAAQIQAAKEQQERIRFHADTNMRSVKSRPYVNFSEFVKSLLPSDKFALTMSLLKFPIPTNTVTKQIFSKQSKIFDGRNPANNYQFKTTQQRDDWEWYRQMKLNEPSFWSTKAWEYYKTEINCVMVVDLPIAQDSEDRLPQPYIYFVPISQVVSYSVNKLTDNMDWIIFKSDGKLIVIDDMSYRVFAIEKGNAKGAELANNPHGLPYCPARFFWNESLSLSEPDVKKSPLSEVLSDLDWYLFKLLSQKHLDIYAGYPIYSGYEEECDYSDEKGNVCSHGHLKGPDGNTLTDVAGNPVPCPLCGRKKSLAGAGTYVTVPIPSEGGPDLRNPIQILSIDKNSLDYNVAEVERLKKHIIDMSVGVDSSILHEASIADKQIDAAYDSQDVVLNRTKKGFESAQTWADTTCCLLRYGADFISANVNYGNEFYTLTPEVLRKRYNDAKSGGASEAELDALNQQLIETQYRHNPMMQQRMIILSDLEPYRHLNRTEMDALYAKNLVSDEEMLLKNDFMGFIRKFERENINILEFGTEMDYSKKIDTIYNTLISYAAERKH